VNETGTRKRRGESVPAGNINPEELGECCELASENLRTKYARSCHPMAIERGGETVLAPADGRITSLDVDE
jgi:hypothetical protein